MYLFLKISNGESSHRIAVGIAEQAYIRIGEQRKPKEVWYKLAEDWLRLHLNNGKFNPFKQPSGTLPPVPLEAADHWIAHGKLP